MIRLHAISILLLFAHLPHLHAATLQIYGANQRGPISTWRAGPKLNPPMATLCPDDLPSQYTIVCTPDDNPSKHHYMSYDPPSLRATFLRDGTPVRTERFEPFTIAGDTVQKGPMPWNAPMEGDYTVVECRVSNGEAVSVRLVYQCDGRMRVTAPSPRPVIMGMPEDDEVKGEKKDDEGIMSGGVIPDVPDMPTMPSGDCVVLRATEYDSKRGEWEKRDGGLAFKPDDNSGGTDATGSAPVEYSFVAPVSSRYAVTVDMTTSHGVDHNDIWLDFPAGGFTLTRGGDTRSSTGWTKAYHNRNGRSQVVFSVDFNPHSFSTRAALRKGERYVIKVGGRSTKVTVFNIILFPCQGDTCRNGGYWNTQIRRCLA